ncbi:MAG: hypothetical protein GY928_04865 [Colwellia sp.]|nr:hypothetical protein [Colwellia sp.]
MKRYETEEWENVEGSNGYYSVSNKGRVRSNTRIILDYKGQSRKLEGKIINGGITLAGYRQVSLSFNKCIKPYFVHRLTLSSFVPNIENKPQVNHKDGNKLNNTLSNLEWCTCSENTKHAFDNKLATAKGERNGRHKLKNQEVLQIKAMLIDGKLTHSDIANKYGVHRVTISDISTGKHWSHLN